MAFEDYIYEGGSEIYYSVEFRRVVEDHLIYLRTHRTTEKKMLIPSDISRYTGDLFGYLAEIKVPFHMHWSVMRASGMLSPAEFSIDKEYLLLPHITAIDDIRQRVLMTYS